MGVQCNKASLQSRRHKSDPWMALCVSSHAVLVALHPALQRVTLIVYEAANGAQVSHSLLLGVVGAFNSSFSRTTHLTPLHECNIHIALHQSDTNLQRQISNNAPREPTESNTTPPPTSQSASQPVSQPASRSTRPANQRTSEAEPSKQQRDN